MPVSTVAAQMPQAPMPQATGISTPEDAPNAVRDWVESAWNVPSSSPAPDFTIICAIFLQIKIRVYSTLFRLYDNFIGYFLFFLFWFIMNNFFLVYFVVYVF